MDPVVHFEMPYENRERLVKFYTHTFGWQMQQFGEDMGNYVVANTTELDDNRMPVKAGAIGGGFYPEGPDMPKCPSVVIAVEDITLAMKKVVNGGGEIQGYPVEIPGIGQYIAIIDTEGNRVGILQPMNR
jgi:predicted enzyme related to lactoylglutathione lyase